MFSRKCCFRFTGRVKKNWRPFVAILTPFLLSPIMWATPDKHLIGKQDTHTKFRTAYVVAVMAVFWVFEVIPMAITALLPLVLFPLLGIQHAAVVSKNYMKESNMIFLGAIILALAIEFCGLHLRAAIGIIRICGAEPARLMLGIMVVVGALSMWISDTSATTMILPTVSAIIAAMFHRDEENDHGLTALQSVNTNLWDKSRHRRESHVFVNAALLQKRNSSFSTIGFGVKTKMMTNADSSITPRSSYSSSNTASNEISSTGVVPSPSVNIANSAKNIGDSGVSLDDMASFDNAKRGSMLHDLLELQLGSSVTTINTLKKTLSSQTMESIKEDDTVPNGTVQEIIPTNKMRMYKTSSINVETGHGDILRTTERIEDDRKLKADLSKMLLFAISYAASIGGTGSLVGTSPIKVFKELAKKYKLEKNKQLVGITFFTWMGFNIPPLLVNIFFTWLFLLIRYIGVSRLCGKTSGWKEKKNVEEYLNREYKKLGPISAHEVGVLVVFLSVVVLWLLRDPQIFPGWDSLLKTDSGDSTAGMFGVVLLFIIPRDWSFIKCWGNKDYDYDAEKRFEPLLDWKFVSTNAPWGYILLIGSGYAIADASDTSGFSAFIAEELTLLRYLPKPVLLLIVMLLTSLLTEFVSNAACANLLLPIVFGVSCTLDMHPIYLTMASAVTASYAFMLPISSPPNAIIFATGELRIKEMLVNGLILNLVCIAVLYGAMLTYGEFIFKFSAFDSLTYKLPMYNCSRITSGSIFQSGLSTVVKVGKVFGLIVIYSPENSNQKSNKKSCSSFLKSYWQVIYCHYTMFVNMCILASTIISFIREQILDTTISTTEFQDGTVQFMQDGMYHMHIMGTTLFGVIKGKQLPTVFQSWRSTEAHLQHFEYLFASKSINSKKKWENSVFAKEMVFTSRTSKSHNRFIRQCKYSTVLYLTTALFGGTLYFVYEYEKMDDATFTNYLRNIADIYAIQELKTWLVGLYILYFGHILEVLWAYGDMLLFLSAFSLRYQFKRFNKILHLACTEHARNLNCVSLENLRELHWTLVKVVKETTNLLNSITVIVFTCNIIYLFSRVHLGLSEDFSSPKPLVVLEASFEFLYLIVRIFLTSCMAAAFQAVTTDGILYLSRTRLDVLRNETLFHLLERFQNQISSSSVGISGNGYFVVNKSFVATVASALVTYQVMILQLHTSSSSKA